MKKKSAESTSMLNVKIIYIFQTLQNKMEIEIKNECLFLQISKNGTKRTEQAALKLPQSQRCRSE